MDTHESFHDFETERRLKVGHIKDELLKFEEREHELRTKRRANPAGSGLAEVLYAGQEELEEFIEHGEEILHLDEAGQRRMAMLIDKMVHGELDDPSQKDHLDELAELIFRYEQSKPQQSH